MPSGIYKHKPHSNEWKKQMSEFQLERYRKPEEREKLSKIMKIITNTSEAKKRSSIAHIGKKFPKELYPNKGMSGKHHSKETKEKMNTSGIQFFSFLYSCRGKCHSLTGSTAGKKQGTH